MISGKARGRLQQLASRAYTNASVRYLVRPWFRLRTPEKWVFIIGCYNSGTTITRHIIGAHPDIRTLPREGVRFTSVLRRPEDLGWPRMWLKCSEQMQLPEGWQPKLARRIMQDWTPWWGTGGSVFLEKSIANILRMRWLEENFPNAYFIGITRNGYCVAEGIRRKAGLRGASAAEYGERYPIELAAQEWCRAVDILQEEGTGLRHYHHVRYEDLVEQPVKILEGVWSFLGLTAPAMTFANETLTVGQRRFALRNMNGESLARLSDQDRALIAPVISGSLARLGYGDC